MSLTNTCIGVKCVRKRFEELFDCVALFGDNCWLLWCCDDWDFRRASPEKEVAEIAMPPEAKSSGEHAREWAISQPDTTSLVPPSDKEKVAGEREPAQERALNVVIHSSFCGLNEFSRF